jgi:hypothetical protein
MRNECFAHKPWRYSRFSEIVAVDFGLYARRMLLLGAACGTHSAEFGVCSVKWAEALVDR